MDVFQPQLVVDHRDSNNGRDVVNPNPRDYCFIVASAWSYYISKRTYYEEWIYQFRSRSCDKELLESYGPYGISGSFPQLPTSSCTSTGLLGEYATSRSGVITVSTLHQLARFQCFPDLLVNVFRFRFVSISIHIGHPCLILSSVM
ncbi:hypothetical protein PM082_017401 [Marasmius tenuissimus]|nr:hypothetical protein PM082_017401 [Marasmius tenuissimus]